MVFTDECHATGFFGPTGRGTEEYFGLEPGRVDIINSTLGKALGGASGGYTTASAEVVDLLRQRSRPYLFSNSLPPPVVASASKVLLLTHQASADVRPSRKHKHTTALKQNSQQHYMRACRVFKFSRLIPIYLLIKT